jgi:hypothetical protein
MSLLVADTGDVLALQRMLNFVAADNCKLHLFSNSYTPAKGDTVASYTECVGTGYAAATCTGASWSVTTVSHVTTATYPAITFTFSVAQTVYGYYITNNAGTTLIGAEAFPSALTIPSGGGTVTVTLNITGN